MAAAKKSAAKGAKAKGKAAVSATPAPSLLETVPPEVLSIILDSVEGKRDMASLCGTCKDLHALMMPRLHQRVILVAEHFGHIPAMIRTVQRYLSIAQKKELRKMGTYKGQQETYPAGVDEHEVPDCTRFIQELVIGKCNPGKKHDKIAHRYIEEFLKNVTNVRVVETNMLTGYIAERLASWDRILALNVDVGRMSSDIARRISGIRRLEHLGIVNDCYNGEDQDVAQRLLRQSASSLKTLYLDNTSLDNLVGPPLSAGDDDDDGDDGDDGDAASPRFTALENLDVFVSWVTQPGAEAALKAIDFTQVAEIKLAHAEGASSALYRPLAAAFKEARPQDIKLRRLLVDAAYHYEHLHMNGDEPEESFQAARFGFVSSFSQLEALEITNYRSYPREHDVRPHGFPDLFAEAILKHQGLKTLKITNRTGTTDRISYLSPGNVSTLLLGLPHLDEFEFSPDEWDMDAVVQCLPLGNLSSISCNMYELGWVRDKADPKYKTQLDMLQTILQVYLDYTGSDPWLEKMNKLRTVAISKAYWQLFTQKPDKGSSRGLRVVKAAKKVASKDGKRTIWYQEVSVPQPEWKGYRVDLPWMKLVSSYR